MSVICVTVLRFQKIKDFRVSSRVGCWITAFQDSSSSQAVAVDGHVSQLIPVIRGLLQGTVLGHILFLVHISGIADKLSASTEAS